MYTTLLESTEEGTRVIGLAGRSHAPFMFRMVDNIFTRLFIKRFIKRGAAALEKAVEEDIRTGRVFEATTSTIPDQAQEPKGEGTSA